MIYQEELSNIHIFLEQEGKEAEKERKKKDRKRRTRLAFNISRKVKKQNSF